MDLENLVKNSLNQSKMFLLSNGHLKQRQQGVLRTNCIDCLDRTNVAQFVASKVAFERQLAFFNIINSNEELDYQSSAIAVLLEMCQLMGDTIAVQYAGSNLVNTVDSYKSANKIQTRDLINTLKRYYNNSFLDVDKQHGINLLLGLFKPWESKVPLWELHTDYYLHNPYSAISCNLKWIPKKHKVESDKFDLTTKEETGYTSLKDSFDYLQLRNKLKVSVLIRKRRESSVESSASSKNQCAAEIVNEPSFSEENTSIYSDYLNFKFKESQINSLDYESQDGYYRAYLQEMIS